MNVYHSIEKLPEFKNAVLTIGTFDGLHAGHKKLISKINSLAKEINGESIVITFHPHPREIIYPKDKSLLLLSELEEKIRLFEEQGVDNLIIVKFSIEFSQQTPKEYVEKFIIQKFTPKIVVIGYDHKFGLNRAGDFDLLKMYEKKGAFDLVKIEKHELEAITISSTKIRNALIEGELQTANLLLGYNYSLEGKVVHGQKIGKSIGFPTANIDIASKVKLIPKVGVYAVRVHIEDEVFNGMAYIGMRPTIDKNLVKKIEVNIFDFNQNIYTKKIRLELLEFIRQEMKFDNVNALVNQLKIDKHIIQNSFQDIKISQKKSSYAIAILNYNGEAYLKEYLPSLYQNNNSDAEIIVIDNASTDGSIEVLNQYFPEIKIIELRKNYGFAEGYNKGIEQIEYEQIILLNSDVAVTKDWDKIILKTLNSNNSIGAVMPKILSAKENINFEYAGAGGGFIDSLGYPFCRGRIFDTIEKDQGQYNGTTDVFWTSGAAMAIRKSVFQKLGGFDESYFAHMEEIDLCWRMQRAGYTLKVNPDAVVYHLGGGSLDYNNPKKTYLNFKNNLTTLIKNESVIKLIWLIPIRLILDGVAGIQFLLKGKWSNTKAIIKAHFAIYGSLYSILKKRKEYSKLIQKASIGKAAIKGRIFGSILIKYYLLRKKKFSEL